MSEDLSKYCAEGSVHKTEMFKVSEKVSLKVISFTPAINKGNPSIVFIAGWISLIKGWKEILKEMTRDFTVHYVESREKNSSIINDETDFSVEAIGKDIVRLITKLNFQERKYILCGSSLGATAILECAKDLKTAPHCLVLIAPNSEFRIPRYGLFLIRLFYTPLYEIVKPYVKWYLKKFRLSVNHDYEQYEKYCDAIDAADPWKLKRAALAVSKYSLWNKLDGINFPALIIGASKDKLHEPENLKKIVSAIQHSTYLDMYTNKGTHSKEVVDEIRKYISEVQSS